MDLRNQKGFTLIELIVVIAIVGIILTPISSFLITNIKIFYRAEEQIQLQTNLKRFMEETADVIRGASLIAYEEDAGLKKYKIIFPFHSIDPLYLIEYDEGNKTLFLYQYTSPIERSIISSCQHIEIFSISDGESAMEPLPHPSDTTRIVKIHIKGRTDKSEQQFTTKVSLRNK